MDGLAGIIWTLEVCQHIREPWGALIPDTHQAPPPPRYQHLSAAYSPITLETQRERQKGLTRQVFEQDASGDERSSPDDSVRKPWAGVTISICTCMGCGPSSQMHMMGNDPNSLEPKRKCISPVSEKLRVTIISIY